MFAMQDGRIFTNYRSTAEIDSLVKKENNLKTQKEFRDFMNQHSEELRQQAKTYCLQCDCEKCYLVKVKPLSKN